MLALFFVTVFFYITFIKIFKLFLHSFLIFFFSHFLYFYLQFINVGKQYDVTHEL